jgi:hypothetical protein
LVIRRAEADPVRPADGGKAGGAPAAARSAKPAAKFMFKKLVTAPAVGGAGRKGLGGGREPIVNRPKWSRRRRPYRAD